MREWNGKRYHSLDYFLREKFGEKVFKIALDAGFTCPNRDGTIADGGCIFCSKKGSGDFTLGSKESISKQFSDMRKTMESKWKSKKYIAYFQAFTNTYGPTEKLKELYYEALSQEGVVGIAIATRPDCLNEDVLNLLSEIDQKKYLWVELGLQTSNENIAKYINRGYELRVFDEAVEKLNKRKIDIVVHIIFGLPNESKKSMIETVKYVSIKGIRGIKFHLLHLVQDSPLYDIHIENEIKFLSKKEYIDLICRSISILPEDVVIHRLTGDGPRDTLIGPLWSLKKWEILNQIDMMLKMRDIYQGVYSIT